MFSHVFSVINTVQVEMACSSSKMALDSCFLIRSLDRFASAHVSSTEASCISSSSIPWSQEATFLGEIDLRLSNDQYRYESAIHVFEGKK